MQQRRPGERFAYASTNYVLLGMMVERATGTSLGRELRRRIFAPLGLEDTSFEPDAREGATMPTAMAIGHTGAVLGTVSAAWSNGDGRRRVVAMSNSLPLSPSAGAALKRLLDASFCG